MARSAKKYVYYFGNGKADGSGKMKDLLAEKERAGQHDEPEEFRCRRVHHHHGGVQFVLREQEKYPPACGSQVLANLKKVETRWG